MVTITLSLELEQAEREGTSAEAVALDALQARFLPAPPPEPSGNRLAGAEAAPPRPLSGADMIAYWRREGVLGTFADRPDSPEFAEQLRRQAQSRLWEEE